MAGQLSAIADARRSRRDRNATTASPRPTSATRRSRTPSTCAASGTRSPTRAAPPRASAGRSPTRSCAGTWSRPAAWRPTSRCPRATCGWPAKEWFQRETFPSTFLETDGTSLKAGLDVVRKFGVALEAEFPWDGFVTKDYEIFNRDVRRRRIMAYYNLGLDAHEWRHWLHASGPVAVLIKEDRHLQAHRRRPRRLRRGLGHRQPRRRAVRLRPGPLPAALELGHRLGRRRLRAHEQRLRDARRSSRATA